MNDAAIPKHPLPRAIYHQPQQEKPCEECAYRLCGTGDSYVCGHNPKPFPLEHWTPLDHCGTCDYWEKDND